MSTPVLHDKQTYIRNKTWGEYLEPCFIDVYHCTATYIHNFDGLTCPSDNRQVLIAIIIGYSCGGYDHVRLNIFDEAFKKISKRLKCSGT